MNWKEFIAATVWLFGIALSIIAIFAITRNFKLAVGVLSISLGILAIIWVSIARKSLSPGSSLRVYITYFLLSLIFIMLFSIWNISDEIFNFEGSLSYIGYIFIAISYFVFLRTSYQILSIGKEFGFQPQVLRIKSAMEEKNIRKPAQDIQPLKRIERINKQLESALKSPKKSKTMK